MQSVCGSRYWAQKGGPTATANGRATLATMSTGNKSPKSPFTASFFLLPNQLYCTSTTLNLILPSAGNQHALMKDFQIRTTVLVHSIDYQHESDACSLLYPGLLLTHELSLEHARSTLASWKFIYFPLSTLITPPCVPLASIWCLDDMDGGGMTPATLTRGASFTPTIP